MLTVDNLAFGFGAGAILEELSFEVPASGVTVVLGPAGVGKSTLLRTLARRAELLPSFWWSGRVELAGRDLIRDLAADDARRRIALLMQKARLYTASVVENAIAAFAGLQLTPIEKRDLAIGVLRRSGLADELEAHLHAPVISLPLGLQRRLSLARIIAGDPAVLLVDEPTRDINVAEQRALEAMLVSTSQRRAVMLVTHDLSLAQRVADHVVLLVAGRQVHAGPARPFFASPPDDISRRYLASGNAWPDAPRSLTPPPLPVQRAPAGFHWMLPGLLGGMARPGLIQDEREDLAALAALGAQTLITLEEDAFAPERVRAHGIEPLHLPIPDMGAPTLRHAETMVRAVEERIARGSATVYHCKAGLGRTGTMLAAHLIHRGMDALHALEEIRAIHPRYVQSTVQEDFLVALAATRSG